MADSLETEALPLIPLRAFDCDVASLSIATCRGMYASCRYLEFPGDINGFLASVPARVIGDHSWRRRRDREYLFVLLLNDLEPVGGGPPNNGSCAFLLADSPWEFQTCSSVPRHGYHGESCVDGIQCPSRPEACSSPPRWLDVPMSAGISPMPLGRWDR